MVEWSETGDTWRHSVNFQEINANVDSQVARERINVRLRAMMCPVDGVTIPEHVASISTSQRTGSRLDSEWRNTRYEKGELLTQ